MIGKGWKNKCLFSFMVVVLCLIVAFIGLGVAQDNVSKPQIAPLNPEFIEYLEAKKAGQLKLKSEDGKPLGYIPPPLKLPKEEVSLYKLFSPAQLQSLPSKFDLRTLGGVTPVRNQGDCGSCWSFATMASLESFLKYKGNQTWDFSEQDLIQYHGFFPLECEGGHHFMSSAYLTRWDGPVTETDVPYLYATPGVPVAKHVQNIWFLPNTALDTIKNAVYNYGAIYIAFKWDPNYYNSTSYSYYYPNSTSSNHAVVIVGWDDNFSKDKFKVKPPGNGAFIVKNSWGTSWGENGYFYLSYYDKTLSYPVSFYSAESVNNYKRIYQYDPLGWVSSFGYGNNTAWMANVFIASINADLIKAIGFYAATTSTQYTIYVYDNLTDKTNPRSGALKYTKTGTVQRRGYVTVPLGTGVKVTPGKRFSIVVKLTTPNYNYPIPVERYYQGYSDNAICGPYQSFISSNGSSWTHTCKSSLYFSNVNLKAYATKSTQ